jgi:alkanesulfonate monooxygenase SsuD/methylene tetrahydromethanopterin reductase-like flavin-dependent oxidoreductase (luciferase family)
MPRRTPSTGRAEVMAGRGSVIESFLLFGYDLSDYQELFLEKLDLLLQLREDEVITWQGRHRAPISERPVHPRPQQDTLPVGIGSHGFIADTSQKAANISAPGLMAAMNQIGRERGWGSEIDRAQFDRMRQPHGALMVGSPAEVTEKILAEYEMFGNHRTLIHVGVGNPAHAEIMGAIDLYGDVVAPAVRKEVARLDSVTVG